jgi:hypothetical protein
LGSDGLWFTAETATLAKGVLVYRRTLPKQRAMPVVLTREEELETWMAAPWAEAARLQRPLPDGSLQIVARGERKDELAAVEAAP